MKRRLSRYQQSDGDRFSQLELGDAPPDQVFNPTRENPVDYSYLISPVHRKLGWRLRGFYEPQGAGVEAEVYLDIPHPEDPESFMRGKYLGHAYVHWIGLWKQNHNLPGSPRETTFRQTYEPQIRPSTGKRGTDCAATNYLTAALDLLRERFNPATHSHVPMERDVLDDSRFRQLEPEGLDVLPRRDPEQLDLPFGQVRWLEVD